MATSRERTPRRADALSRGRIVAAAIEVLDTAGEDALTFRALAASLSTGTGSIYWYLSNKDELLAATTNAIIERVLDEVPTQDEPAEQLRATALGVFDAIESHPWIGSQLAREPWRVANMRIFEAVGSKLQALGVHEHARFDAASALTNYIFGTASQNAAHARNVPRALDRAAFLAFTAERWEQLDPADYPFVHEVVAQLRDHDDRSQFLAGIDIILSGIRSTHPSR